MKQRLVGTIQEIAPTGVAYWVVVLGFHPFAYRLFRFWQSASDLDDESRANQNPGLQEKRNGVQIYLLQILLQPRHHASNPATLAAT